MKISSQEFRNAFEVVNAVEDDTAVESSHFIRLQQNQKQLLLTLTGTTWAEAFAKGNEAGKWTTYIDRRILKAFLATANGKEIEVLYKDKQLTLKSNNRLELGHHPLINGYESWKPANTYDLSDELKTIIATGTKYLSSSAGTENVAAVNFKKDYGVVVTDTLYLFGVLGAKLPADALIPPTIASAAGSMAGKLAIDQDGVGIALDNGFLYEPLSTKLAKYPFDSCKTHFDNARQAPAIATASVKDISAVFRDASAFLLDKAEAGVLEIREKGIQLTVTLSGGVFRRSIPATFKLPEEVNISVKKFLPWLDLVSHVKKDATIELAKLPKALVMRFTNDKKRYVFIAADL